MLGNMQCKQAAGREQKGSQHRRQASDAHGGGPLGNGDVEHSAEDRIRFGDEPENSGRKGSGSTARVQLDIEQPKAERRTNGHYSNLSGALGSLQASASAHHRL